MQSDLEQLRGRLDELDDQLVRLIAERQDVIAAIGEVKSRAGRQIRDFRRERIVLNRARDTAVKHQVDPNLCESLFKLLIASSLTRQERERVTRVGHGRGKKALVIGAKGNMGGWFVRFLEAQEYTVEEADIAPSTRPGVHESSEPWEALALDCDLILVAVPLSVTASVLDTLATLQPRGVVIEIASIKAPVLESLRQLHQAGVRVASLHPMFGPNAQLLAGRHVLSLEFPGAESTLVGRELFAETMAEVVTLPITQHDRLMTYVLGMTHALNLVFGAALARSGEDAEVLARLSSTTFDAQLAVTSVVASENPRLYFEIQRQNPSGSVVLEVLGSILTELQRVVSQNDEEQFTRLMQESLQYLEKRKQIDETAAAGRHAANSVAH